MMVTLQSHIQTKKKPIRSKLPLLDHAILKMTLIVKFELIIYILNKTSFYH